jgi:alkanesulfonate monooxygenase SsuD/methylene tetrahydromethanopterin reductase-like flavin-dependent oxidoreductase (luciferase family)
MSAPPPIYVGGRGDPALARAARFGDVWLPMWLTPEKIAQRAIRLAELATERGRPTPATALLAGVRIEDDLPQARREAEAHMRGQYRMGLDAVERWTLLGSIDTVVDRLESYRGAGVQEVLLMTLGSEPLVQYERLAEVRSRMAAAEAPL